jgi:NADPH:quinone reductase-like Zn-dependent oxidoreductase
MRTIRFHAYGEAADVLVLENISIPEPGANRIRILVHACGLNPADWALCKGLLAGSLPRGIGPAVSGTIDAFGEGVDDVRVGDKVFGTPDWAACVSAGASDYAIMDHWALLPPDLDLTDAAALPMAVETAFRSLAWLGVSGEHTLLVNGAGTMIGFAAVQMALLRGSRVIATAGGTFAERLRAMGATVTPYGDGMVERVRDIAGGSPDLILDTAPVNLKLENAPVGGVLPDLVKIAGGDPRRVLTTTDFAGAEKWGVRTGIGEPGTGPEGATLRYDKLGEFAQLAAEGRFIVPVARTFALEEWRNALDISESGRAHGKLMLLPGYQRTVAPPSAPESFISDELQKGSEPARRPVLPVAHLRPDDTFSYL